MLTSVPVIETRGLSKSFGTVTAVTDLTIQVSRGEVFGFLGHNGAGKTTAVRMLNGILAPTAGTMSVLGFEPLSDGPSLRRRTGVLTETPSLDDRLTARETLSLYGRLYGVQEPDLRQRVDRVLALFELGDRADELVGAYSKGTRQRLALARTLTHEPEILFLDEPTTGLDPVARRTVHDLITHLSQVEGHTVFLCTHDLAEAQKLCDRVGVMEQGRLVALGTPDALADELQQGVRLEIEVDRPPFLLDGVAERTDDHGVASEWQMAWDPTLHAVRAWLPNREGIPDLIAALLRSGTRVYGVVRQDPTLEDVYFAIHDRDAGDGKERA